VQVRAQNFDDVPAGHDRHRHAAAALHPLASHVEAVKPRELLRNVRERM
jgi:hypothetical protein